MKLEIFDYGMNAEGIGKLDGKVCMVDGALNGEIIDCSETKTYPNYLILKLNAILKPSPNRCEPECQHYYECGGCKLQHMSYAEQLRFKNLLVEKTLKKITGLALNIDATIPSYKQYNYRNKVSFTINNRDYGFLKEKSKVLLIQFEG